MPRETTNQLAARKGESGVSVYGRALLNRQRAVIDDVFEQVKDTPAYRKALAAQFVKDPIGSAERLEKIYGEPKDAKQANPLLNISNLYLQAVQGMQAPEREVLELEAEGPGTSRVQPTASDW